MATTKGRGILYYGEYWAGYGKYEIVDVGDQISGHFVGKPMVFRREDTLNASLRLSNGERIKVQILGDPVSERLEFRVLDGQSATICREISNRGAL